MTYKTQMEAAYKGIINTTRDKAPLIHNITNYVSANDCANITLACGASPIMAEELDEVEEVTSSSAALVINTGILTKAKLAAMLAAGRRANELGHPVILDPVGLGVSNFRRDAIWRIIQEIKFQVIRGNSSEIRQLYEIYEMGFTNVAQMELTCKPQKGVDVSDRDVINEDNLDYYIMIAKKLALYSRAIIVMTGTIDIVTDGLRVNMIRNGSNMLGLVSGSGCMLSALIGAYCGANERMCFEACVAAVGAVGLCGEYAYEKILRNQEGSASYRMYLIDYINQLDGEKLMQGIRLEER